VKVLFLLSDYRFSVPPSACAKRSFLLAESLDSLQLTAVDKALLQQTAAHKRTSKSASFRIALLGGAAEATKVSPELVASRNAAGRALRSLYEAQGFKKRRSTKEQRIARQQREVDRARKVFQEALDARANSNQDRTFNSLVDTLPTVAAVNAPPPDTTQWRNRDGVLRDRSGSAARDTNALATSGELTPPRNCRPLLLRQPRSRSLKPLQLKLLQLARLPQKILRRPRRLLWTKKSTTARKKSRRLEVLSLYKRRQLHCLLLSGCCVASSSTIVDCFGFL
jgi:hypothetical protein